jgi:hypothetical protein
MSSDEKTMTSIWRVEQIVERAGYREAELMRIRWYKLNPAYTAAVESSTPDNELPDEYLETQQDDPDAIQADAGGTMTVDITDGPELKPEDTVTIQLSKLDVAVLV